MLNRYVPRNDAPRGWTWTWVPHAALLKASWPIWQCPLESTLDEAGHRHFLVLARGQES